MKTRLSITHLNIFVVMLSLSLTMAVGAPAANLDGHMQYHIISYNFNNAAATGDSNSKISLNPLLISEATSDVLTHSLFTEVDFDSAAPQPMTSIFGVSADYLATPDLALYGAFGITKSRGNSVFDSDYSTGWEANLGAIYTLFHNIRYEVHFGYMDTGDLFEKSNAYTDVESIIMISNKLTMSF